MVIGGNQHDKKGKKPATTAKEWQKPEINDLGKIEDVTQKSVGAFDGIGLENVEHHPSM